MEESEAYFSPIIFLYVLYFSNWGTETDSDFKGYHNGNGEYKGFGKYDTLINKTKNK